MPDDPGQTDDLRRQLDRPTPIRDAAQQLGPGGDLFVDQQMVEVSGRVATDTKHGQLAAGVAVRKWYDGPLEYFGFASWRPRRK